MSTKRPTPLTDAAKAKYLAGALPITDIFQPMAELETSRSAREQRTHAERVCVDALAKRDQAERDRDAAREQRDALLNALCAALPFVEDALKSEDFKPGYVAQRVEMIRAAIAKAEGAS